jgi:hemerythrin-like domain-containing protein
MITGDGKAGRRTFALDVSMAAAGALLAGCTGASAATTPPRSPGGGKDEAGEGDVSPAEDLMREHGVLNRVILVYEEAARRIDAGEPLPPETLASAASLIRRFIEDYHEKLEEEHLFPRFEKAGMLVDLVGVLRAQHQAGRRLTDAIQRLATPAGLQGPERTQLAVALRHFSRMYRPHEAREDTVLFPAFRGLIGAEQYAELGEAFEDREHALFGEHGFENIVSDVAKLESALGIADLARFTAS